MRAPLLFVIALSVLAWSGWAAGAERASSPPISSGRYRGTVDCRGSDRFSNASATRRYRSSPIATVEFASRERLTAWTYFFLLPHDVVKQVHAVRPGASFTYGAGAHVGRPGRTRVTITAVTRTAGRVLVDARLDWSSPATHYIGSGTYALVLERVADGAIRYEAVKVVVKHRLTAPSKTNPVIRRNELCVGQLAS